jgi:hypothetical protein
VGRVIRVVALGWKAAAVLERTRSRASVLAPLSESIYLTAGDEILWLGCAGAPLHPRAALTDAPLPSGAAALELACSGARVWTPAPVPAAGRAAASLRAGGEALRAALGELGRLDGFGPRLAGRAPSFPLDAAADRAARLAAACGADDPDGAAEAAADLLGLGPGLTPSGDDFVGAAFFAKTLFALMGATDGDAWAHAGARVVAQARARTHPISVALLADMVAGHGHAPLHDLARALATGAPRSVALDAARRLTRIGHCSGWDMLAGFVAGISGR